MTATVHAWIRGLVILAIMVGIESAWSVTYDYDSLGRVRTATYADGTTIEYQYDVAGNRTSYTVSSGSPSAPNAPASILPTYQFVIASACLPGHACPNYSGGMGGATSVTWAPPAGGPSVDHYELQQAFNSASFSANLLLVYSGAALSWVPQALIGANPNNWYYYRVRACNSREPLKNRR